MKFNIEKIHNKKESFIWKLDPRLKILTVIFFFILVFLPTFDGGKSLTLYLFLTFLMLLTFLIAKLPWKTFKVILKSSFLMMFFLFLFNMITFSTEKSDDSLTNVLLGFIEITKSGLMQTIFFTLRVTLIILISVIFVSTTSTIQMTRAIESLLRPLKYIKFPVHIFAMIITLSLRLIPTIINEAENIITAQASRGLDFRKGGWKTKIKSLISLLIPLMISILRKADEMTIAMESRGYDPDKKRTIYFQNQYKKSDWVVFLLILILIGSLIFFLNSSLITTLENVFEPEEWLNNHSH